MSFFGAVSSKLVLHGQGNAVTIWGFISIVVVDSQHNVSSGMIASHDILFGSAKANSNLHR